VVLSRGLDRLRAALPSVAPAELLAFASWSGLAFGLAEGVAVLIRRRINHLPTGEFSWHELLWMPPLAGMAVWVFGALSVVLLDRTCRSRGFFAQLLPSVIIVIGVHDLVLVSRLGISTYPAWILALGCAVVSTRILPRVLPSMRRWTRWQLPLIVAAIALWAVGVPRYRQLREQQARGSLTNADPAAPNVLVILWDTVRALSLSLYGHSRATTPALAEFAAGGAVFQNAFATSAWSLPSHASLYTGRYPHETKVGRTGPLGDEFPTLGDVLAQHGYVTGGFTANLFYGSRDFGMGRGFGWYDDEAGTTLTKIASTYNLTRRPIALLRRLQNNYMSLVNRPASDVSAKFLSWVDRRDGRPFYAFVNYFDAHAPYSAPAPFNVAFAASPPRYWVDEPRPTDSTTLKELETAYESSILYLDHELGKLLTALRQRGILDNTLVIVTADHGEQFGDHDPRYLGHERSLYASALRVPLVMVYPPMVPAAVRRNEVVSIRDIPATVMQILNISEEYEIFPGTSLLRYVDGSATPTEVAEPRLALLRPNRVWPKDMLNWANTNSHIFSLAAGELQYIVAANGTEELYDFVSDPWQGKNLTSDTAYAAQLARFRQTLSEMLPGALPVLPDTIAH
jgi:arylsulfatase A-like enzyme